MPRVTPLSRNARFLWPLLAFLPGICAMPAAETAVADRAWRAIIDNRSKDVFRVIDGEPRDRGERLARATAYLDLQPTSDDNMQKAEDVFADLAKGDDDIAYQAAYLQARLYQVHYSKPDYAKASALFEQLAARVPDNHWAQLGLVKLAMLKLYEADESVPGAHRLTAAEIILTRIKEPPLRRDLELQIGQAGILLKQPLGKVLPHLIEADRIGGISGTAAEDLLVQLGELSFRDGQLAQAKMYFERYLKTYPGLLRAYPIERRLEEIQRRENAGAKGGA